jgi:hypothetical protein
MSSLTLIIQVGFQKENLIQKFSFFQIYFFFQLFLEHVSKSSKKNKAKYQPTEEEEKEQVSFKSI